MAQASRERKQRNSRETPEARQLSIIEATKRCVAKFGYPNATIDRICAEANISRGLINHHFSSKDDLMIRTYEHLAEQLREETRKAARDVGDSPELRLTALIRASFAEPIFTPDTLRVWLGFWSVVPHEEQISATHRKLYDSYRRALTRLFEEFHVPGSQVPAQAAMTLTALIDGFWLERAVDPGSFTPEAAEAACLRVARGFLTPAAG